jgi:hypothetical protein
MCEWEMVRSLNETAQKIILYHESHSSQTLARLHS